MFYGKESIEERVELLRKVISWCTVHVPAPSYCMGERWNDELRIKHGYTQLEDGSWATVIDVDVYLDKMKQDMIEVYDNYQDSLKKNRLLKQKNYEMEFGLRHAQKSLNKALAMEGDNDE
jgi:hypothetical protein